MRNFSARETEWLLELDGIELASFWRRAIAFVLDWILISILMTPLAIGGTMGYLKLREMRGGPPMPKNLNFDMRPGKATFGSSDEEVEKKLDREWIHVLTDITIPVLYFGCSPGA